MEALVFKVVGAALRLVGFLMLTGLFVGVLSDLQKAAFSAKSQGLINLRQIGDQLVGETK